MSLSRFLIAIAAVAVFAGFTEASPAWFPNDYDGFIAAAGNVHEIDFEKLPDGTPSIPNTPITPEFNYTNQGVTFSSPNPVLEIGWPLLGNYPLHANDPSYEDAWVVGELVTPATAVGISFPGHSTMAIYDTDGALVESMYFGAGGNFVFLGVISDIPIGRVEATAGSEGEAIWSFWFTPVPEPGALMLVAVGGGVVLLRRKR